MAGAHLEAESSLRARGTAPSIDSPGNTSTFCRAISTFTIIVTSCARRPEFRQPSAWTRVINFEATTNIQQYEITLNFTGQASKMSLSYRSDPPLPGNDIVTLPALGQTTSEATIHGGVTGSLARQVQRSHGFAHLKRFPATGPAVWSVCLESPFPRRSWSCRLWHHHFRQNVGARVTVEQQVTRDLT